MGTQTQKYLSPPREERNGVPGSLHVTCEEENIVSVGSKGQYRLSTCVQEGALPLHPPSLSQALQADA